MTVDKIINDKEQNDLRDLKQQIKSLTMIMKSATMGSVKSKGKEGVSSPRKKEMFVKSPQKGYRDHLKKERYLWNQAKNLSSVTDVRDRVTGGASVQLQKT